MICTISFVVLTLQRCMKHDRPETRTVRVGHRAHAALGDEPYVPEKHIDNRVISSKVCFREVYGCLIS